MTWVIQYNDMGHTIQWQVIQYNNLGHIIFQANGCCCGNSYGKYERLDEQHCQVSCPGHESHKCGGIDKNSVYRIIN